MFEQFKCNPFLLDGCTEKIGVWQPCATCYRSDLSALVDSKRGCALLPVNINAASEDATIAAGVMQACSIWARIYAHRVRFVETTIFVALHGKAMGEMRAAHSWKQSSGWISLGSLSKNHAIEKLLKMIRA